MTPCAWMAVHAFRTANLPHREIVAPRETPVRDRVRAAFDRTWRTRLEVGRMTGASQRTVGKEVNAMLDEGLLEWMRQKNGQKQFRRRA